MYTPSDEYDERSSRCRRCNLTSNYSDHLFHIKMTSISQCHITFMVAVTRQIRLDQINSRVCTDRYVTATFGDLCALSGSYVPLLPLQQSRFISLRRRLIDRTTNESIATARHRTSTGRAREHRHRGGARRHQREWRGGEVVAERRAETNLHSACIGATNKLPPMHGVACF